LEAKAEGRDNYEILCEKLVQLLDTENERLELMEVVKYLDSHLD